jgi:hypothetical protein
MRPRESERGTSMTVTNSFQCLPHKRSNEHHELRISLNSEGTTGKVSQLIMPIKSVDNKKFCFNEQTWILNPAGGLKQ